MTCINISEKNAARAPVFRASLADDPFTDNYGRQVRYVRVSVTDRCNMRCVYCMSGDMTFFPRDEVLSLEEMERLCVLFIRSGVRKIRLTGGEPLCRRNVMDLVRALGRHLHGGGLDELTMTTNGSRLEAFAGELAGAGVRRVNVSLDTLDAERYGQITRRGDLGLVLRGIDAALRAGLHVKLNAVAMRATSGEEWDDLIRFAHGRGMDLTIIEEMPLGQTGHDRSDSFLPLWLLRQDLETRWSLSPLTDRTAGPARYMRVAQTGGRIGFITPLSCDFCAGCDRLRIGCTGDLFPCMGSEDAVSLKRVLRDNPADDQPVTAAIHEAVRSKPQGHSFQIAPGRVQGIRRHMSVVGG